MKMKNDLLYQLALTRVPGIGPIYAKRIYEYFGEAAPAFGSGAHRLESIFGIGAAKARSIRDFSNFQELEQELTLLEKYSVRPLFYTDPDYPRRLLQFDQSPALLFYKGNADLNAARIVSVIGTRTPTEYGKQSTERLIRELAEAGILVVSGLAYGIDTLAHQASLKNNIPTVGVLGHGFHTIYPPENNLLAKKMLQQGGLLSRFPWRTEPDEHNFPQRNQIVAGICDALLVIESTPDGGSMITARDAISYGKKIFALPGRITDIKSTGCNNLIHTGDAHLLTNGMDLLREMNWVKEENHSPRQSELFPATGSKPRHAPKPNHAGNLPAAGIPDLPPDETKIIRLLQDKGPLSLDALLNEEEMPANLPAALLNLELSGLITPLPGKAYQLCEQ